MNPSAVLLRTWLWGPFLWRIFCVKNLRQKTNRRGETHSATPENWRKILSSARMVCRTGVKKSASRYLFNLAPVPLVLDKKLINNVNGTNSPPGWEDRSLTRIKEHWREKTPPLKIAEVFWRQCSRIRVKLLSVRPVEKFRWFWRRFLTRKIRHKNGPKNGPYWPFGA